MLVIEVESWPHQGSTESNLLREVVLEIPASPWEVLGDGFKELSIERCTWLIKSVLLALSLHVSEMKVIIEG